MKIRFMYSLGVVAASGLVGILAACGGGGDDSPVIPATSLVPPEASQSSMQFIAYVKELVASPADNLEPVDISQVSPPADNAGEPVPID